MGRMRVAVVTYSSQKAMICEGVSKDSLAACCETYIVCEPVILESVDIFFRYCIAGQPCSPLQQTACEAHTPRTS